MNTLISGLIWIVIFLLMGIYGNKIGGVTGTVISYAGWVFFVLSIIYLIQFKERSSPDLGDDVSHLEWPKAGEKWQFQRDHSRPPVEIIEINGNYVYFIIRGSKNDKMTLDSFLHLFKKV